VPGLRRQEVASLAGVGAEYYKRVERGSLSGVSELMREALAQALQLDDAERAHLLDLARAAAPTAPRLRRVSGSGSQRVRGRSRTNRRLPAGRWATRCQAAGWAANLSASLTLAGRRQQCCFALDAVVSAASPRTLAWDDQRSS
jgi:transcriptional regulator with XRE-family HTH domain